MLRRTVRCYVVLLKMLRGTVRCYVGLLKMLRSTVKMLRRTDYEKKFRVDSLSFSKISKESFDNKKENTFQLMGGWRRIFGGGTTPSNTETEARRQCYCPQLFV